MEKKFQVFISSTYEDLKDERQEVIQALLELDCIPAGMELFPAADDGQWTLIKRVIDDCDYYIVIVGARYGSVASDGVSYTQKEYEYAVQSNKPVIGFLHRAPTAIPYSRNEASAARRKKLEAFRELVKKKTCKEWSTPQELGSVVSRSLIKLMKTRPAIGWVRGNAVADEAASKEILTLKKEIENLEQALGNARLIAPEGSQDLAQGTDQYGIDYCFVREKRKYSEKNPKAYSWVKEGVQWDSVRLTWNLIFSTIAPSLINPATESMMIGQLLLKIRATEERRLEKEYPQERFTDFKIATETFDTIKIQLRALGLISMVNDLDHSSERWLLTPYGDNTMTTLLAIKKRQSKQKRK